MLIANLKQQPQALLLNWKPNMSWKNFKGAIAQHIPGTTTNRINKINRLSENPESLSSIEQARIAAGHVMGRGLLVVPLLVLVLMGMNTHKLEWALVVLSL